MEKLNINISRDVIYIIVIGLLLWLYFKPSDLSSEDVYKTQIDSLKKSISTLEIENKKLDSLNVTYSDSIDSVYIKLEEVKKQREENKIKYEQDIKNISKLTNSDVSKFFTERYGK